MTSPAVELLRNPRTIRARCENIYRSGGAHFRIVPERLDAVADRVAKVTRAAYPDLAVPAHGRMGHFGDRVSRLRLPADRAERARTLIDLVVTSVLLDAGAGMRWRFREADTGLALGRSEGLAVASLHMFASGALSGRADDLERFDTAALVRGFQVTEDNPLTGVDGRAQLLRRLGGALRAAPGLFGADARIGNLYDHLAGGADGGRVRAADILRAVLVGLGPIWPGRLTLDGVNLGDVWRHPAAGGEGASAGLVPFHKLSQWLTYSLLEPLEQAGLSVIDLDDLTGLAEYRNGGLFVDMGVLVPRDPDALTHRHAAGDELVVEWRALTLALLDRVADPVRARLGVERARFPLARILEGGTWRAGREVAAELRPDGGPPLAIDSDGTVF